MTSVSSAVDLSILIPVYNEEESIPLLYQRILNVLDHSGRSFEIILIDDGSRDGSLAAIDKVADADRRVKSVVLSRNFGQTAALMAGIRVAKGNILIPMDGDLQNDPGDILRMLEKLEEGYDVVSGWRRDRQDKTLSRKVPSWVANRLISALLGVRLHDYGCSLKAYRRWVIEDVRLYGEMHRFIPIYAAWEGARVAELPVTHHARTFGKSKYGLGRVTRVMLDLLVLYFIDRAFDRPIQFFGKVGLSFLAASFLSLFWALGLKFLSGVSLILTPLPLLAATFGGAGTMFILMGLLAEIQVRTYFESQGRTHYKVKTTRNIEDDAV